MRQLSTTRILFLAYLLLAANLLAPIEAAYLSSLGLSVAQISMLNLSVPLLCAVLEVPTGILGDWVGRKQTVVLSASSFLVSAIVLLEARSFAGLQLAYLFEAAGWSFFSGNTEALVVEDSRRRSEDTSRNLSLVFSALTLGAILAGVVSSGAITSDAAEDLRSPLLVMAVLRGAALLLVLRLAPVPRDPRHRSPTAILHRALRRARERFAVTVIAFEALGRLGFYLPVVMQLLLLRAGVGARTLGVLFSALLALQYLFQRHNHALLERLGRRAVLDGSTLTIVAGLLLMIVPHPAAIVLGMLLVQLVGPLRYQCLSLIKNEVVDDEIRATYLSTISLCVLVVNAVLLAAIGWLVEHSATLGLGVLAAAVAICVLLTPVVLDGQRARPKEPVHVDT
jgi:MFS family permease